MYLTTMVQTTKLLGDLYGMQELLMPELYQTIVERAKQHREFTFEASCPQVYSQRELGSCVANAIAAALRFAWKNTVLHLAMPYADFGPLRLWIYYYSGLTPKTRADLAFRDTGYQIRNALKVLKTKGVFTEEAWPFLNKSKAQAGQ